MTAPAAGLLGAQGVFRALRALAGRQEGAGRRRDAARARQPVPGRLHNAGSDWVPTTVPLGLCRPRFAEEKSEAYRGQTVAKWRIGSQICSAWRLPLKGPNSKDVRFSGTSGLGSYLTVGAFCRCRAAGVADPWPPPMLFF